MKRKKKSIVLEDGEVCIKGSNDFINWLIVSAFRYCVNRHPTQAMYGVGDVILDNLDVVADVFIDQFIRDIEHEQEIEEISRRYQHKEQFDFFYRLKVHVEDYQRYLKDERSEPAQKLYHLLNEVMDIIPKVDMSHKTADWTRSVEDTSYLTPMLNKLKEEREKRKCVK